MTVDESQVHVAVTFRHTEPTEALKSYAIEKLCHSVAKFVHAETEVSVVLSVEKRDHIAEVFVHTKGSDVKARSVTDDLYAAIDKVVDVIDVQLRKLKEKHIDQKHTAIDPMLP